MQRNITEPCENKMKLRHIFLILIFLCSEKTCAIESTVKINVAVFHFINNTEKTDMNVLQYALREKLNQGLIQNNRLHLIEYKRIYQVMAKRDMDIKDNLKNPRILQYIGGLVNAEILIFGHFTLEGDSIVILTNVIDATQGKVIKRYRASGSLGYINNLVGNITKNIIQDMPSWQTEKQLPEIDSMAHNLGKIVAQTEVGINDISPIVKKDSHPDYTGYLLNAINLKSNIQRFLITETNDIISISAKKSALKPIFGWIFFTRFRQHIEVNPDMALKDLQNAQYFLPNEKKVKHQLAKIYTDKKDYSSAIEIYMELIQTDPDDISAYIGIGHTYLLQKSYFPSIFFLSQAVKKDPYYREIYILLGEAYERSNQTANAIETMQSGLKRFPEDIGLKKLLAIYQVKKNNPYLNK